MNIKEIDEEKLLKGFLKETCLKAPENLSKNVIQMIALQEKAKAGAKLRRGRLKKEALRGACFFLCVFIVGFLFLFFTKDASFRISPSHEHESLFLILFVVSGIAASYFFLKELLNRLLLRKL